MSKLTPMKAIRAKCLDCSCGNAAEVRRCHITACPLWCYRAGRKPSAEEAGMYTGEGEPSLKSEKKAAQMRARMQSA
jgi:hypothetical protein